ncbi:hypothetical protein GQ457_05G015100 [Hibiscus cannabinus]
MARIHVSRHEKKGNQCQTVAGEKSSRRRSWRAVDLRSEDSVDPHRSGLRGYISANSAAIVFGGFLTLNLAATVAIGAFRSVAERKWKKIALTCGICKGKGYYLCKLCNGNATIKWSPLYEPIHINPCVCPTCDGNRVQRCLNCLGKGYS